MGSIRTDYRHDMKKLHLFLNQQGYSNRAGKPLNRNALKQVVLGSRGNQRS